MKRVLVALDGLPESVRAAQAAVDLFGADNEFLVVNVAAIESPSHGDVTFGAVVPMSGDEWNAMTSAVDTAAQARAETGASEAGIEPTEIIVKHGDPVAAICDGRGFVRCRRHRDRVARSRADQAAARALGRRRRGAHDGAARARGQQRPPRRRLRDGAVRDRRRGRLTPPGCDPLPSGTR